MNMLKKVGLGVGLTAVSGMAMAQAQAIDVGSATTAFSNAATAVGLIGVGMVALAAAGIAYRWVTAYLLK